ncbi:MAG: DUF1045 domain-containing protein [Lautropia sp.]
MGPSLAARYAVYWMPTPEDPLAVIGREWLGRDAANGNAVGGPPAGLRAAVWRKLVAGPARYGFHATLRAPMRLVQGAGEADVLAALHRLARTLTPVALPRLGVSWLGEALALRPFDGEGAVLNSAPLRDFAQAVVEAMDPLRAAPTASDLARHDLGALTGRRRELLLRWGYPHVAEQFRFHLTLTGALGGKTAASRRYLQALLARHFEPVLGLRRELGALTLFVQPHPDLDFVARASVPLGRHGVGLGAATSPADPVARVPDDQAAQRATRLRSPSSGSDRNAQTRAV